MVVGEQAAKRPVRLRAHGAARRLGGPGAPPRHRPHLRSIRVGAYFAAGEPMPVPGVTEPLFGADEALAISRDLLPRDRDLFALIVRGGSMIDATVPAGDSATPN